MLRFFETERMVLVNWSGSGLTWPHTGSGRNREFRGLKQFIKLVNKQLAVRLARSWTPWHNYWPKILFSVQIEWGGGCEVLHGCDYTVGRGGDRTELLGEIISVCPGDSQASYVPTPGIEPGLADEEPGWNPLGTIFSVSGYWAEWPLTVLIATMKTDLDIFTLFIY